MVNFPPIMQDFFKENPGPRENTSQNRAQLKQKVRRCTRIVHNLVFGPQVSPQYNDAHILLINCVPRLWNLLIGIPLRPQVEEEYAIWASSAAASDTERIAHFSSPNNSFFLCVVWKFLTERESVLPLTYR